MFCRVKPVITYFVFSPIGRCNVFVFTGGVHATQKGIEVQDITLLAVKIGKGIITAKYFDKKKTHVTAHFSNSNGSINALNHKMQETDT